MNGFRLFLIPDAATANPSEQSSMAGANPPRMGGHGVPFVPPAYSGSRVAVSMRLVWMICRESILDPPIDMTMNISTVAEKIFVCVNIRINPLFGRRLFA
jgi:hypothetical protein